MYNKLKYINLFEQWSDVDPYGEEDWEDKQGYKIGDKLICKEDIYSTNGLHFLFYKGKKYEIMDRSSSLRDCHYVKTAQGWPYLFSDRRLSQNFDKVIEENKLIKEFKSFSAPKRTFSAKDKVFEHKLHKNQIQLLDYIRDLSNKTKMTTKLFEEYLYPDSLIPISDILTKFVYEKFMWWYNRKGIANFSDNYTLYMDDFDEDIPKNDDFPLRVLRLKTKFVVLKDCPNTGTYGFASWFREKGDPDINFSQSYIYRGKINASMECNVHLGNSFEPDFLKNRIDQVIRHELLHLYYFYKKIKKGYKINKDYISNLFLELSYSFTHVELLCNFLQTCYMFTKETEKLSRLTMASSNGVTTRKDVKAYYIIENIFKYENDFENFYNELDKQMRRKGYTELDNFPKLFLEEYIENYDKKVPDSIKGIDKLTFKEFVRKFFNMIMRHKKEFLKKLDKEIYSKNLN